MRKSTILFIIAFLLFPGILFAAPFIVCDPQAGVMYYKIIGWALPQVTAQTDGSVKLDVATAAVGATNLSFAACWTDPVWGEACSAVSPFVLTRPAPPVTIKNIKLSQ